MLVRNLLLSMGVLAIVAGAIIAAVLLLRPPAPGPDSLAASGKTAVLVATRPLPSGALLREGDLGWREIETRAVPPNSQKRGEVSGAQVIGSITRRGFTAGEIVPTTALIGPNDRRFLAAVLSPGSRAVTIAVDAAQSASGLVLPDDRVDVILVQDLGDPNSGGAASANRSVAQILLHDVRVVAVDRAFNRPQPTVVGEAAPRATDPSSTQPRTITLEVSDRDAQRLLVALQVGKVDLTLRALARPAEELNGELAEISTPVWGAEISPLGSAAPRVAAAGGPPMAARQARPGHTAAPIRIVRGSKVETP